MYTLKVEYEKDFAAGHTLDWHPVCNRLHGHNYVVTATFEAQELDENGVVMDFGYLRTCLNGVLSKFDHTWLNNHFVNPTTERFAKFIYDELQAIPRVYTILKSVTVRESRTAEVTYERTS